MKIKIDKLDTLFSEVVRRRAILECGGCQYCGKKLIWRDLQCSHFIGRRKRSTRFDLDNACGLEFSCHQYLGEHPYEHTEFFKKRLGTEKLEELVRKGNMIVKIDRDEVEDYLKKQLAYLTKEL